MQIGLGIGATFRRKWVPPLTEQIRSLLFGAGQQGALYDPSDLSTLFQDAAGTTPVTAMGQPVGRMLDLSGNGNHASQATTTKRGVVSRRVNLLTKTEQFENAVWSKNTVGTGVTPVVTDAFGIAPDGTQTATRLQLSVGAGTASGDISYVTQAVANAAQSVGRIWVKLNSGADKNFALRVGSTIEHTKLATSEWQEFSISNDTGNRFDVLLYGNTSGGSIDLLVWRPSITITPDAHLPYQWVNTATDYDADPNKFPTYIRLDGVDDAYQTNSIDFTGTDKMTVWAGITKLSDAAPGIVAHAGVYDSSAGFLIAAPPGAGGQNVAFRVRRSALGPLVAVPGIVAPATAVVTGSYDGVQTVARAGGAQVINAATAGTGTLASKPLIVGSQDGVGSFFNGRLYQLIVRGAQSSLSQLEAGELLTKSRMKLP